MSLNLKKNSSKKSSMPEVKAGSYMGRIVQVIGLGIQPQEDWKTKEPKKPAEKVLITVEFPTIRMDIDGESKACWVSKKYTVSTYEMSSMYKQIIPLLDGSMDLNDLLGGSVLCQLGHTENGNLKVVSIGPPLDGIEVAELENPPKSFDFYEPDIENYKGLYKWQKDEMKNAVDFDGSTLQRLIEIEGDDES
jgi:hypothetical protein